MIGSFSRHDATDRDQCVWEERDWSGPDAALRDVELSPGDIYLSYPHARLSQALCLRCTISKRHFADLLSDICRDMWTYVFSTTSADMLLYGVKNQTLCQGA